MITSVFNKSKPVNLLLCAGVILLANIIDVCSLNQLFDLEQIKSFSLQLVLVLFSIFLVDFISKKNNLSDQNSFPVFFYSIFFISGQGFLNVQILIAHIFLLLAYRKVLSLKTEANTIQKTLDASIWIACAAWFFAPALISLVILYIALITYRFTHYKNFLVPIVGVGIIAFIGYSFQLFFSFSFSATNDIQFSFLSLKTTKIMYVIALLVLFLLLAFTMLPKALRSKTRKAKSSYGLVGCMLVVAIVFLFTQDNLLSSLLIFLFAPLCYLLSAGIEKLSSSYQSLLVYGILLLQLITVFI